MLSPRKYIGVYRHWRGWKNEGRGGRGRRLRERGPSPQDGLVPLRETQRGWYEGDRRQTWRELNPACGSSEVKARLVQGSDKTPYREIRGKSSVRLVPPKDQWN